MTDTKTQSIIDTLDEAGASALNRDDEKFIIEALSDLARIKGAALSVPEIEKAHQARAICIETRREIAEHGESYSDRIQALNELESMDSLEHRDRATLLDALRAVTVERDDARAQLAQAQKEIEHLRANRDALAFGEKQALAMMGASDQALGRAKKQVLIIEEKLAQAERDKAAMREEVEELKAAYRQQNAEAEGWKRTANELYTGNPPSEPSMVAGLKLMREHQRQRDEMKMELCDARAQITAARTAEQRLRNRIGELEAYDFTYSVLPGEYLRRSEVLALFDARDNEPEIVPERIDPEFAAKVAALFQKSDVEAKKGQESGQDPVDQWPDAPWRDELRRQWRVPFVKALCGWGSAPTLHDLAGINDHGMFGADGTTRSGWKGIASRELVEALWPLEQRELVEALWPLEQLRRVVLSGKGEAPIPDAVAFALHLPLGCVVRVMPDYCACVSPKGDDDFRNDFGQERMLQAIDAAGADILAAHRDGKTGDS